MIFTSLTRHGGGAFLMAKLDISIGFKIDREYEAQLDQALAITGEDRATFVREAVRVAMTRTIKISELSNSEPEPTPQLSLESAAVTIRWLERTLVDFKQVADDLQRQQSVLQVLKRADADAMHRARAEFLEGYPERIMKSQKPVHDKLTELSGKMDNLPGIADILAAVTRIEGEVVAALASMMKAAQKDRKTAASEARETRALIEKAMAEPRTINTIDLGDRSYFHLGVLGGIFWLISVAVLYAVMMLLPADWIAVRTANHLLGGGQQAVCQLVNFRESTDTCRYQIDGRKGVTKVSVNRDTER